MAADENCRAEIQTLKGARYHSGDKYEPRGCVISLTSDCRLKAASGVGGTIILQRLLASFFSASSRTAIDLSVPHCYFFASYPPSFALPDLISL